MYAIFISGGKQYKAYKGDIVRLEKLNFKVGSIFSLNQILIISSKLNTIIGNPLIQNGKIEAKILAHGRSKKIQIVKFNRRKHYKKKQGHRQYFTDVSILNITN